MAGFRELWDYVRPQRMDRFQLVWDPEKNRLYILDSSDKVPPCIWVMVRPRGWTRAKKAGQWKAWSTVTRKLFLWIAFSYWDKIVHNKTPGSDVLSPVPAGVARLWPELKHWVPVRVSTWVSRGLALARHTWSKVIALKPRRPGDKSWSHHSPAVRLIPLLVFTHNKSLLLSYLPY